MIILKPEEFFELYRNEYLPAYSDIVGFTATKPKQILVEIENVFSHFSQYYNPSLDIDIRQKNLEQAHTHLTRITMDCYKLLWVLMNTEINTIYLDSGKQDNAKNFSIRYQEFRESAKKARENEMGGNNLIAIKTYRETVSIGKDLLRGNDGCKSTDNIKLKKSDNFITIDYC